MSEAISRKDFIKKTALGALSLAALGRLSLGRVEAGCTDNLGEDCVRKGDTPPADKSKVWIDTNNDGVMKYWNGSTWKPIRSTWDA